MDIIDLKFRFEFADGVELTFPVGTSKATGPVRGEYPPSPNPIHRRSVAARHHQWLLVSGCL